jgi:hypothetical protein
MNRKLLALLVVLIGLAVGALAIWQFIQCYGYEAYCKGTNGWGF